MYIVTVYIGTAIQICQPFTLWHEAIAWMFERSEIFNDTTEQELTYEPPEHHARLLGKHKECA